MNDNKQVVIVEEDIEGNPLITIPQEFMDKLGLKLDDYLSIEVIDGIIHLKKSET